MQVGLGKERRDCCERRARERTVSLDEAAQKVGQKGRRRWEEAK